MMKRCTKCGDEKWVISSAKVQIAYHALRGEAPNIPFLAAPAEVLELTSTEAA